MGHGPKQEIQRVRLRHLKHLLGDATLSLAEIARRMQFGSAHELSRFFLAEAGQRPSDFRAGLVSHASRPAVKAVIFDMDGTLFDTEPVYFEAYRQAYARQGGVLTREDYFGELMGRTNDAIEAWLGTRASQDFDLPAFRREWREIWKSLVAERPPVPLPGVKELLARLFELAVPVALASSSDRDDIHLCLEVSGLAPYFPVRAAGDEVAAGKPAPDIYQLACRRLGVEPADCLAIEDSYHGITSARAAGIKVLWVTASDGPADESVVKIESLAGLDETFWKGWLGGAKFA